MSKCIYKPIADSLDKDEVEEYYKDHLPHEVAEHFGFNQRYFYNIFDYLGIQRRSASENTRLQLSKMTDAQKKERPLKMSAVGVGHEVTVATREKIGNAHRGVPEASMAAGFIAKQHKKGDVAWNKGVRHPYSRSPEAIAKWIETRRANGTLNTSKPEELVYEKLCGIFGADDIHRQYSSDPRYPYNCDFYISSLDRFIELNLHWSHGGRPYIKDDPECAEQLQEWEEKAQTSKYYTNAINTWTVRDVNKLTCAEEHNLNYTVIYNFDY